MEGPRLQNGGAPGSGAYSKCPGRVPRCGGYLPPELLQLPPGLQPRALHLLQPGPQVPGLLAHGHPSLFEERQFLLLVLIGKLQAERGRGQRQPTF